MSSIKLALPTFKYLSHFDRLILGTITFLTLLIVFVLWRGDQSVLRVTQFSWAGQKIGVEEQEFTLSFNRPVEPKSVEQNLAIEPPLTGKVSWSGRKLFYTLTERPIYGINYQIKLEGAKKADSDRTVVEPFTSLFSTRDRAFAYIGITPQERGRLVLVNITQKQQTLLTPPDLVVTDYAIYPQGDKIVFSAYEVAAGREGKAKQQLYTVATGLNFQKGGASERAGKLQTLLGAKDYENQQFALSKNGETLIVQRQNPSNPADAGLWALVAGQQPRPLGVPGGDFTVAPDGKSVALSQPGGIAIIPLVSEAGGPKFLPGYEKSLGFSPDGLQQLAVKNNGDYTRSLVLLAADGTTRELFKTINPIVSCQFEPRHQKLIYCLKTDLVADAQGQYQEEPYLSAIDVNTGKDISLLALPNYRDVQLSMSPDGVALLFDQVVATVANDRRGLLIGDGKAISDGRLWLFTLPELEGGKPSSEMLTEELNPGFKPQWLP
jgi:hypothetical protein